MTSAKPSCTKDDFHRERSKFLDAFAALEEAMIGHSPNLTDKRLAELLKSLRAIRNDLVHSQLRVVPIEGKLHAVLLNPQNCGAIARQGRVVALDDFKALCSQLGQVRKGFAA